MFHCIDDELELGEHFDTVCRGNPEVKLENRSMSKTFEDCKISSYCTRPDGHSMECN
jgi:hypothetical protein